MNSGGGIVRGSINGSAARSTARRCQGHCACYGLAARLTRLGTVVFYLQQRVSACLQSSNFRWRVRARFGRRSVAVWTGIFNRSSFFTLYAQNCILSTLNFRNSSKLLHCLVKPGSDTKFVGFILMNMCLGMEEDENWD